MQGAQAYKNTEQQRSQPGPLTQEQEVQKNRIYQTEDSQNTSDHKKVTSQKQRHIMEIKE